MKDGKDLTARQNLCTAAYAGGQCLNMETTGYIHPFCHKIGAKYGLVHGRCIGAVMPIILEDYGEVVAPRLAKLAVSTGIADPNASQSEQAKQFIQWVRDFDATYGIDPYIPEIKDEDLDEIADSIMVEIFVYPNKKVYTRDEIKHLLGRDLRVPEQEGLHPRRDQASPEGHPRRLRQRVTNSKKELPHRRVREFFAS